jgi:SAM-dependent methyltransferase
MKTTPLCASNLPGVSPMSDDPKNTTRAQWDRAAPGWNAHGALIGAWLARATEGMLGMAGIGTGSRVLDVAAGAGEQTLMIARRVGRSGSVLATDLSPAILALAEDNALSAGLSNVQFQVADGEDLQVEPAKLRRGGLPARTDAVWRSAAGPGGDAPGASAWRPRLHHGVLATAAQPLHHDPDVNGPAARRLARPQPRRAG